MGQKLKIAGWVAAGALAGAMTTVSLQTVARGAMAPLPLEELQQMAAVFGMIKSDYVEPVDEKKLISDAISGMVASLDPHSQYFDKKTFKEFREGTTGRFVGVGIEQALLAFDADLVEQDVARVAQQLRVVHPLRIRSAPPALRLVA